MSTWEKEWARIPEDIRQGVIRWAKDAKKIFPSGLRYAPQFLRHPDWPYVIMWASNFPLPTASGRAAQTALLAVAAGKWGRFFGKLTLLVVLDIGERLLALLPRPRWRAIARPPGYLLLKLGRVLLTKRAYERLMVPHVADMQHEFCEALKEGRPAFAWWIEVRGYLHAFGMLCSSIGQFIRSIFFD
jgi:hypothetical protein